MARRPEKSGPRWWNSWLATVLALLGASVVVYLLLALWLAAQQ
jgi:hypothetical protein